MNKNMSKTLEPCIWAIWTMLSVLIMMFAGCAHSTDSNGFTDIEVSVTPKSEDDITVDKSIYMDPARSTKERVDALMAQMTLEEKVAQMLQAEQNVSKGGASISDVTKYGIGSILNGGGSAPASGNTAKDWEKLVNAYKQAALDSRLGIPLLYGVDAVHGHNNVLDATVFPHNIGLGATQDTDLVTRIGQIVAQEVRATGINWTFAPTMGNPQNERWGRYYECFGENIDLVTKMSQAYIKGLQGVLGSDDYLSSLHVAATAKHYIGEGYTKDGINQGNVDMTSEEFYTLLEDNGVLEPYKKAVEAGVQAVMISYNSVDGLKCHENYQLITNILKNELGFKGIVISDFDGIDQVQGNTYKDKVVNCVNAGIDMCMEPFDWKKCMNAIIAGVNDKSISMDRINDAVERILTVKFEMGLFEEKIGGENECKLLDDFGSNEHREVARQAVCESLVLLKNDKYNNDMTVMEYLPECKKIMVTGSNADDIGNQCGGWTISWQGSSGDITTGTTILEGIEAAVGDDVTVKYNEDGIVEDGTQAVIVVAGEKPYAEGNGDRAETALRLGADDQTVLNNVYNSIDKLNKKIPVILILVSGRPLTIADYVGDCDAVIEAWLPGTEGEGVADVLFGDYDFTGTLPVTWPWYGQYIDEKFTDDSAVLFKPGTGLKKDGSSILKEGTQTIGDKPKEPEFELNADVIDIAASNYVLEAELYNDNSYEVSTGKSGDITYVSDWSTQWANTKWNVYIPKTGSYELQFLIASLNTTSDIKLYYQTPEIGNDDGNAIIKAVPIKKTENLDDYQIFSIKVDLTEGQYEFKFMATRGGKSIRLDKIRFILK